MLNVSRRRMYVSSRPKWARITAAQCNACHLRQKKEKKKKKGNRRRTRKPTDDGKKTASRKTARDRKGTSVAVGSFYLLARSKGQGQEREGQTEREPERKGGSAAVCRFYLLATQGQGQERERETDKRRERWSLLLYLPAILEGVAGGGRWWWISKSRSFDPCLGRA